MNKVFPRIALVGPLPPPYGGMANQTQQLIELLHSEGIAVEPVQVNCAYKPDWISNIHGVRALFRLVPYLFRLWQAASRNDLFHIMANSGWSWHLYAAPAIWIAKARGKRVVVNYRGGEAEAFFSRSFAWVRPSLNKVDEIVVPSNFLAEIFSKRGFRTKIVPNIINLSRFSPVVNSEKIGGPNLLVARNLEPLYDNATAIRAFAIVLNQYPNAHLIIAGSGGQLQELEALAKQLGIGKAVEFVGKVPNDKMPELYRNVHIAVNPSLADNMPISILEALASSVPVVSTNVGGVPFLVEHEDTALLVPPGDHEEMAAACLRILGNELLAKQLVEAGQIMIKKFSWLEVQKKLFAVYRGEI